tara:strand:- start:2952 stop:3275 length:324 start_codon:yes stop_codon:yes gene_type:complete
MAEEKEKGKRKKETALVVPTRGRTFQGIVTKKFSNRVVIEFERIIYIQKYERYQKKKTKIHARLMGNIDVQIGDLIQVQECRPLSKLIHFIVTKKIEKAKPKEKKEK